MDLKHHWKNRINDNVLCIIVIIDSKYGSGKYRRLGRQTFKKKMAYNFQVQRATHETPFFLTYLHSPRLPYFDLEKPGLLYRGDWSFLAFTKMQNAFKQVRDNLEAARDVREKYFNKKTKE